MDRKPIAIHAVTHPTADQIPAASYTNLVVATPQTAKPKVNIISSIEDATSPKGSNKSFLFFIVVFILINYSTNIIKKLDIKTEGLVGFEIYLDRLKDNKIKLKDLKSNFEYSDYQKSERDFAFVVDKNFKAQDLIEIISSIDKNLIRSIKIFDIYEGENIPQDKKSIALNVTIQSSEKTLEESDLEKINKLIISTVETKSGAKIRS